MSVRRKSGKKGQRGIMHDSGNLMTKGSVKRAKQSKARRKAKARTPKAKKARRGGVHRNMSTRG